MKCEPDITERALKIQPYRAVEQSLRLTQGRPVRDPLRYRLQHDMRA